MPYKCVVLLGQRTLRAMQTINIRCVVRSANFTDWAMSYVYVLLSGQRIYWPGNAIYIRCAFGSANYTNWEMPYICVVLSGQRTLRTEQCHTYAWCCRVSELYGLGNAIRICEVVGSANFTDRTVPYICVVLSGQRTLQTRQCHTYTMCCRVSELYILRNAMHMRCFCRDSELYGPGNP
jgi:hypothetical protein